MLREAHDTAAKNHRNYGATMPSAQLALEDTRRAFSTDFKRLGDDHSKEVVKGGDEHKAQLAAQCPFISVGEVALMS